jgi:hypothetical protein
MSRGALAATIVGCVGATLSLIASSTIVHMIRMNRNGLESSLDLVLETSLSPWEYCVGHSQPDSPMALGTTQSCDFFGFIILLGGLLTVFYLIFLIYFFWRRVNHKVTPRNFANGEEKYLHILIWLIGFSIPNCCSRIERFQSNNFWFCLCHYFISIWMWKGRRVWRGLP